MLTAWLSKARWQAVPQEMAMALSGSFLVAVTGLQCMFGELHIHSPSECQGGWHLDLWWGIPSEWTMYGKNCVWFQRRKKWDGRLEPNFSLYAHTHPCHTPTISSHGAHTRCLIAAMGGFMMLFQNALEGLSITLQYPGLTKMTCIIPLAKGQWQISGFQDSFRSSCQHTFFHSKVTAWWVITSGLWEWVFITRCGQVVTCRYFSIWGSFLVNPNVLPDRTPYCLDRFRLRVLTERVRAGPIQISYLLYGCFLFYFFLKLMPSVADGWIEHSETLLEGKGCNEELRGLSHKVKVLGGN